MTRRDHMESILRLLARILWGIRQSLYHGSLVIDIPASSGHDPHTSSNGDIYFFHQVIPGSARTVLSIIVVILVENLVLLRLLPLGRK